MDQQYEHYYIVRKADGMRACFHRWARYEDNDGAQPLVVVFFMNQKRWDELSAEAKAKAAAEREAEDNAGDVEEE